MGTLFWPLLYDVNASVFNPFTGDSTVLASDINGVISYFCLYKIYSKTGIRTVN